MPKIDTGTLRPLLVDDDPFASVWLDVSQDTEDAATAVAIRRRDPRGRPAELGAADDLVSLVDEAVRDAEPAVGRAGRVVVAGAHRVVSAPPAEPPADLRAGRDAG